MNQRYSVDYGQQLSIFDGFAFILLMVSRQLEIFLEDEGNPKIKLVIVKTKRKKEDSSSSHNEREQKLDSGLPLFRQHGICGKHGEPSFNDLGWLYDNAPDIYILMVEMCMRAWRRN
ncbi:hypothetical protein PIB30_020637 [Stylosanthes scabra]|uniref:Uncharacterized protein n=1 Tax=Stylosanthes scabra TaxID=79078 RepID=A0ABU6T8F4_9FABA|nr:hypothetical protein [Stylosanthes scabra]